MDRTALIIDLEVLMQDASVGGSGCTSMTGVPPRFWADAVTGEATVAASGGLG